jgi:hypothetical protein
MLDDAHKEGADSTQAASTQKNVEQQLMDVDGPDASDINDAISRDKPAPSRKFVLKCYH